MTLMVRNREWKGQRCIQESVLPCTGKSGLRGTRGMTTLADHVTVGQQWPWWYTSKGMTLGDGPQKAGIFSLDLLLLSHVLSE